MTKINILFFISGISNERGGTVLKMSVKSGNFNYDQNNLHSRQLIVCEVGQQ